MPWKETDVTTERLKFVTAYHFGDFTMSDLCEAFGISRKTGYKILERYQEEGPKGLGDRSKAPIRQGRETNPEIVEQLLEARKVHPLWGPRKLKPWLEKQYPDIVWPATSTIGDILKRNGLVKPRRKRRRGPPATRPFTEAVHPNDLWCADFKGHFKVGNGARCDPLTITDAFSRYILTCQAVPKTDSPSVIPFFERAFREFGLPRVIRTDNGPPFACKGFAGLTPLSVWWVKLGICPERIEPGKPQQNGRHERMHRTLKRATAFPPASYLESQQQRFDDFQIEFNSIRPHESLADHTPSDHYRPSPRKYPEELPEVDYPKYYETRTVDEKGWFEWSGQKYRVTNALCGETVGLEPATEDTWRVHFGPLALALLNERTGGALHYIKPKKVIDQDNQNL